MKKSQVWVSAVLYMLIAAVAMTLVLQAGLPLMKSMRERSTYSRTEDLLLSIDKVITDVAAEGEGSQRVIPIDLRAGTLSVSNGELIWDYEGTTKIIEPRSRISIGNLVITSNAQVTATEKSNHYILANNYLNVNISKVGTKTNWSEINTSTLINYMEFVSNSRRTNGTFSFTVGNNASSKTGMGYTSIKETGSNLAFSTVVAHVNSTPYEYDLELTLESDTDFLKINVKNLKVH